MASFLFVSNENSKQRIYKQSRRMLWAKKPSTAGGSLLDYKTIHRIVLFTPRLHSDHKTTSWKLDRCIEAYSPSRTVVFFYLLFKFAIFSAFT